MYRLIEKGRLVPKHARDVKASKLGIGFEKLDRQAFDPEKAYDKIAAIGVKWVRVQSGWQRTEREKGVYDFSWLDEIVNNLIARGMLPWICVCYGNPLYDPLAAENFGSVGCPPVHTEEAREAWRAYCRALTSHFKGRVSYFEIWNEPDGIWCWKHGVNPTELGHFTIETAKALREGNSDVYVVGGAICCKVVNFLDAALQTGMADHIDAVSYHMYTFDESDSVQAIRALRGLALRYKPDLAIIQGESGSQSRPEGRGALRVGGWTPRKQCKQLLRRMTADLGEGVKLASYFSSLDMMEALRGKVGDKSSYQDYGYFGVLSAAFDEDGVATGEYPPKPSYFALQNLASLLSGEIEAVPLPILVTGDTAPHTGNLATLKFSELRSYGFRLANGSLAYAYWHPTDLMTTEFEGAVSLTAADLGSAVLVDPMDGTVYEIPERILSRDEFGALSFKALPVRDYPLFLVFGAIESCAPITEE